MIAWTQRIEDFSKTTKNATVKCAHWTGSSGPSLAEPSMIALCQRVSSSCYIYLVSATIRHETIVRNSCGEKAHFYRADRKDAPVVGLDEQ